MCGSVPTTDMINAFYMFDNKTIAIHERLVDIPSVFLREYTHYALLQVGEIPFALGTIGAEAKGGEVEICDCGLLCSKFSWGSYYWSRRRSYL